MFRRKKKKNNDTFTCSCGLVYHIVPEGRSFEFRQEVASPVVSTKQAPAILQHHVNLPFQQSVITGLTVPLVPVVAYVGWRVFENKAIAIPDVLLIYVGFAVIIYTGSWLLAMARSWVLFLLSESVDPLERLLKRDLNRDGLVAGQPQPVKQEIRTVYSDPIQRRVQFVDWPVPPDVLREVAHAVVRQHKPFSRREMMLATSISDGQFRELQRFLLDLGWAAYKIMGKPNSGVVLLRPARLALKDVLEAGVVGG